MFRRYANNWMNMEKILRVAEVFRDNEPRRLQVVFEETHPGTTITDQDEIDDLLAYLKGSPIVAPQLDPIETVEPQSPPKIPGSIGSIERAAPKIPGVEAAVQYDWAAEKQAQADIDKAEKVAKQYETGEKE